MRQTMFAIAAASMVALGFTAATTDRAEAAPARCWHNAGWHGAGWYPCAPGVVYYAPGTWHYHYGWHNAWHNAWHSSWHNHYSYHTHNSWHTNRRVVRRGGGARHAHASAHHGGGHHGGGHHGGGHRR